MRRGGPWSSCKRATDGLRPALQLALAKTRIHRRIELTIERPAACEAFHVGPYTGLPAGEPRGPERGRLEDRGPVYRHVEDVAQELHGPIGRDHAAIDAEHKVARAFPVLAHRGEQIFGRVSHGFESGSREV